MTRTQLKFTTFLYENFSQYNLPDVSLRGKKIQQRINNIVCDGGAVCFSNTRHFQATVDEHAFQEANLMTRISQAGASFTMLYVSLGIDVEHEY